MLPVTEIMNFILFKLPNECCWVTGRFLPDVNIHAAIISQDLIVLLRATSAVDHELTSSVPMVPDANPGVSWETISPVPVCSIGLTV